MNTDKERLKIALQIVIDDLNKHEDWQVNEASWDAIKIKMNAILAFVNKMD
jgi:hypothetical protein